MPFSSPSIPFTTTTKKKKKKKEKRMKYLGINLTKETKGLYAQNYKILMKKRIKDNTNKWRNIPCSLTGRVNIMETTILSKEICRFNAILN